MKKYIKTSLNSFLSKKHLNEGMSMDLDFNAIIEDVDVNGINEHFEISKNIDIDTGKPTAYVSFILEPEVRDWGIKSMNMSIRRITISIEWEVYNEDLTSEENLILITVGGKEYKFNNTISGIIEVDTTQKVKDKEWTITNEVEFEKDGGLSIENIEVDFSTMTITVS